MRKRTIITTSVIGGVLAVALVAGGSAALAAGINNNQSSPQATHECQAPDGSGPAAGGGPNSPGAGQGMRNGQGDGHNQGTSAGMEGGHEPSAEMTNGLAGVSSGTLTSEQEATLLLQAEDEKMSHDLYIAFGELYGDKVFDRIASAETRHLSAVQMLLERYDLTDPTVGQAAGTFSSESVQKLYDSLLAQGSASRDGAFEAARTVEKNDIAGLTAAAKGVDAPDVVTVYGHLLTASEHHLSAFGG